MTHAAWLYCLVPATVLLATARARDESRLLAVRTVAFSPDGRCLAAGTEGPKDAGTITVWETGSRRIVFSSPEKTGVPTLALAPDAKTLAVGLYDHTAKLLDAKTGEMLTVFRGLAKEVRAVGFSPDGRTLATGSGDRTIKLWDIVTGAQKQTLSGCKDGILAVAFAPDGKSLVAAAGQDGIRLWDLNTGKEKSSFRLSRFPWANAALFPDTRWVLAACDGSVRLWDATTGELRARFPFLGTEALALSSRAGLMACNYGRGIRLVEIDLREPAENALTRIRSLLAKLDNDSYAVREAASRELMAIGFIAEAELRRAMKESSSAEVRIRARRLRDALLSQPKATLEGHTDQVEGLAFSPDGKLLASGSKDGSVRLWDVAGRKEKARLVPFRSSR